MTLDRENLHYFDSALDEMSRLDARLPHRTNPERVLIRSSVVDVVMETFLLSRRSEGPSVQSGEFAKAMDGDLGDLLMRGVVQRLDTEGQQRLVSIELLLLAQSKRLLDRELSRFVLDYIRSEDQSFYIDEGFGDLRSAFVEASVLTWMILRGLVAQTAVQMSNTFTVLEDQHSASRRRRGLRLA